MLTIVLLVSSPVYLNYDYFVTVTGDEFRKFFEQFGVVMDSIVMIDRETKRSRGFGFVTFEDPEISWHVLRMGSEQNGQQQDNSTDSGPTVARLQMRTKTIEVKVSEPRESSQRRYDERRAHNTGRPPFTPPMDPNMMMMYALNDPNLYYNYNALGQYYDPYSYDPHAFAADYMPPMYYHDHVPHYYPPVMPMVEGYPQYPAMDAAYAFVPFATPTPPVHEPPYGSTSVTQPMARGIPEEGGEEVESSKQPMARGIPEEGGEEVESSTAATQ
jgi:hypothetical protein